MRNYPLRNFLLVAVLLAAGATVAYLIMNQSGQFAASAETTQRELRLEEIPFNGRRAYEYLEELCDLGPRPSGSPGMQAQQQLLLDHFNKLGGQARLQTFRYRHPLTGEAMTYANVVVEWHPEAKERVVLCAHYDTRPYPDRDPKNPRGRFVGANDGGSGVAILMELAHSMADFEGPYGVDFVLFDAEEFVFRDDVDRWFLGSEYFARSYAADPPEHRYRWGVLLDMVGDKDLQIYQERHSMRWPETRPLVEQIWGVAAELGVREFIPRRGYEIRDDHLMLRNLGKIPTCNIIDFDYPYWHTEADTPDKCSPLSLAKVGWVVQEWLKVAR